MANIIPELTLFDMLDKITTYMITDLETNITAETESSSMLYKIIGGNSYKNETYFNTAKELFLRKENNPNKLNIQLYFHLEPTRLPSISLSVPSESSDKTTDVLGMDSGDDYDESSTTKVPTLNRNFKASLNVIISSKNPTEQTILYHVYRGLMIAILPALDLIGFRNPSLGGKEVQVNPELIGTNMYVRMITLDYFYEVVVSSAISHTIIEKIDFIGTALEIDLDTY